MAPRIDNRWYDALGDEWWAPGGRMALLQQLNPARAAYFRAACARALGRDAANTGNGDDGGDLRGVRLLDVGCGGGYLAEALAGAGAVVTGVDLSATTIAAARRHAAARGLAIDYRVADATALPFADGAFDVVLSSDFLEHVSDRLDAVIAEQARVLRDGGVLGFETVNRTLRARVVLVWLGQGVLRLAPPRLHDPRLFVRPQELEACLARHGVRVVETHGLMPARRPVRFLLGYLLRRESGGFRLGRDRSISYIGYGVKALSLAAVPPTDAGGQGAAD
jgi:2-polyprenyl-6-hydroxyphenyl methylase / 3-demethylubiquinone-9 3-methyltransferase